MGRGSPYNFQVGFYERTARLSGYSLVQQLFLRFGNTAPQCPPKKARSIKDPEIRGQGAFLGEGMYKVCASDEERHPFDALDNISPELF